MDRFIGNFGPAAGYNQPTPDPAATAVPAMRLTRLAGLGGLFPAAASQPREQPEPVTPPAAAPSWMQPSIPAPSAPEPTPVAPAIPGWLGGAIPAPAPAVPTVPPWIQPNIPPATAEPVPERPPLDVSWRPRIPREPGVFNPPIRFPFPRPPLIPFPEPVSRTATQLARSAIVTLDQASADVLNEAINTIRGKSLEPGRLLDYLERRVRVGEVLNQLAATWSETTRSDFADAFQMAADKTDAMDAIVAIAILNDHDLEEELLVENTPSATSDDLLDNRVIASQWPPGGTVMDAPQVILVAVEYRDVAEAQQVVQSIVEQLVDRDGIKLPREAAGRVSGRGGGRPIIR